MARIGCRATPSAGDHDHGQTEGTRPSPTPGPDPRPPTPNPGPDPAGLGTGTGGPARGSWSWAGGPTHTLARAVPAGHGIDDQQWGLRHGCAEKGYGCEQA